MKIETDKVFVEALKRIGDKEIGQAVDALVALADKKGVPLLVCIHMPKSYSESAIFFSDAWGNRALICAR